MATEIYCPKCRTEMTEGYAVDHTHGGKVQSTWVEGEPEESFWTGLKTSNRAAFRIQAFRCPACHYLEFYTTDQVNI